MSFITDEMSSVVTDLATGGIPATDNPGAVYTLVAQHPAVALVEPPEEIRASVGIAALALDVQIWMLTQPPDDLAAQSRLGDALVPALLAALPLGPVERDTWEGSDGIELPAYRWVTGRSLPYPT